jgi:hypothetical protein
MPELRKELRSVHPEDQKAYERMKEYWERRRAQLTSEELQKLQDPGDIDPPRSEMFGHPALNPKTQENLTLLFDAYQKERGSGPQNEVRPVLSREEITRNPGERDSIDSDLATLGSRNSSKET